MGKSERGEEINISKGRGKKYKQAKQREDLNKFSSKKHKIPTYTINTTAGFFVGILKN